MLGSVVAPCMCALCFCVYFHPVSCVCSKLKFDAGGLDVKRASRSFVFFRLFCVIPSDCGVDGRVKVPTHVAKSP